MKSTAKIDMTQGAIMKKVLLLNWKIDFQFAKVNTCSWKSLQEQIPVY